MPKQGKRILLVEDEPGLVTTLTDRLISEGYIVINAGNGAKGEQMARDRTIDLIILEKTLPQKGGSEVCRDLRSQGITTPIMMLTARDQAGKKVVRLKPDADDYVSKPFDMLELLARVESLLRGPRVLTDPSSSLHVYSFGSVTIDFSKREVTRDGRTIELSGREFELLKYFIEHRGAALSRESILNAVWGYDSMPATRTIDTHITWLRQKLEENPRRPSFLLTVHGVGYKFVG